MCPVFFYQVFRYLLQVGPSSQEADVPDELWGQGQGQAEEILPFQDQVIHLPASKLSAERSQGE